MSKDRINWQAYQNIEIIRLADAAALLLEIKPTESLADHPPPEIRAVMQKLLMALMSVNRIKRTEETHALQKKLGVEPTVVEILEVEGKYECIFPKGPPTENQAKFGEQLAREYQESKLPEGFDLFDDNTEPGKLLVPILALKLAIKLEIPEYSNSKFLFPEPKNTTDPDDIHTKRRGTYLKMIKALLTNKGIDLNERGAPGRIEILLQEEGLPLSKGNIASVLKEIKDVID